MFDGMLDGMLASMHDSGAKYHAKRCSGAVRCRVRAVVHTLVLGNSGARAYVRAHYQSEPWHAKHGHAKQGRYEAETITSGGP